MSMIYNLSIHVYGLLIRIASLFNPKAKQWVTGRRSIFEDLQQKIDPNSRYVWFHCASLGEFEQGRPVIEKCKKELTGYKVILTFFSPSGYEIRKNYEGADIIMYLPLDTRHNARRLIGLINPVMAVFVKYEFWFNYLNVLHKNQIPLFIISAIFRKNQHFFSWYGGWFRKYLKNVSCFFVQNEKSEELLESIGITRVRVSGDTRFDRVAAIAENPRRFPLIERFAKRKKVLLAGSSWPEDEKMLKFLMVSPIDNFRIIIAPHEIHEEHIISIEQLFSNHKVIRFSNANETNIHEAGIMIIDGMGFLSNLYQYCDVAYIGGGFGKGLHNILEAVTFGKPVIIGPNFEKFNEAVELVDEGGAFPVHNEKEFSDQAIRLLKNDQVRGVASNICKRYIRAKTGATTMIIKAIREQLN